MVGSYDLYAGESIQYTASIKSEFIGKYTLIDNAGGLNSILRQTYSLKNLSNYENNEAFDNASSTITFNAKNIFGYFIYLKYLPSKINITVEGAEKFNNSIYTYRADPGANVTLTISSADLSQFTITSVSVDGSAVSIPDGTYTISNISKNVNVEVEAKNINPVAGTINILEPVSIFDQLDVSIRQSDLWDMPLKSSNNGSYSWDIIPRTDDNGNRYPLPYYINFDPSVITSYEYRIEQTEVDGDVIMCGVLNLSCAQDVNTDISFSIVPGTICASVSGLNNSIQGYDDPDADILMAPNISKVSITGNTTTYWTESASSTDAKLYAQYSSAFSVVDDNSDVGYYDPANANGESKFVNNSNQLVMKMPPKTFISFPNSSTWLSQFNDVIPDKCSITSYCNNETNTQYITFANDMTVDDVISAGSYNAATNNKFIEFSRDDTSAIKTISYEYCYGNNNLLALTFTDFENMSEYYADAINFYIACVDDSYEKLETLDYDSLRKIPVLGYLKAGADHSCTIYFDREAFENNGSSYILIYTSKIPEDQDDLSFVADDSSKPLSLHYSVTDLENAGTGDICPVRIFDKIHLGSQGNCVGVLFAFDTGSNKNIHFAVSDLIVE